MNITKSMLSDFFLSAPENPFLLELFETSNTYGLRLENTLLLVYCLVEYSKRLFIELL